ncbi:MAG TPA: inorganic phosphate transporter [Planctomycetota bacterium]|nr:inorganic phosphate transporter [Planctomycetota bacterium]
MEWLVAGSVVLLCLYMAWTIGANDVANSMGAAVGSGCITIRQALVIAAIFEFAGAVLVGSDVTDTIRKGIVEPSALAKSPEVLCLGMACALLASALWLHVATWMGMPVSTTHSIVGAVAGFGVVAAGIQAVHWGKIVSIVASWFISPIAGLVLGYIIFKFILRSVLTRAQPVVAASNVAPIIVFLTTLVLAMATLYDGMKNLLKPGGALAAWATGSRAIAAAVVVSLVCAGATWLLLRRRAQAQAGLPLADQLRRVERLFIPLAVMAACSVSFAHGANDVANAVGPLAAVVDLLKHGVVRKEVPVPLWILGLGGVGIVLGLATYGYTVMRTIGKEITEITPSRAVAAGIATAATVLTCTRMGLPVSTSHCVVGAVLGVGLARGLGAVNRRVVRNICGSWLATVPAAAGMAMLLFVLGHYFGVDVFLKQLMPALPPAP